MEQKELHRDAKGEEQWKREAASTLAYPGAGSEQSHMACQGIRIYVMRCFSIEEDNDICPMLV